jgi:hypothetical protein
MYQFPLASRCSASCELLAPYLVLLFRDFVLHYTTLTVAVELEHGTLLAPTFGYLCSLHYDMNISMNSPNVEIIFWNLRSLNVADQCLVVHETLAATPCQIVCL